MPKPGWFSDEQLARRVKGLYDYEQVAVPKLPPEQRKSSWDEVMRGYSHDEARVEALRCMQCQDPPCVTACPAHLDVPGYCLAIVNGDLQKGLKIIMEAFPIPGSCGRVCYHPCTDVCLKGVEGAPIEIPRLRRYITDHVDQKNLDYQLPPDSGFKIAVIGSGPSGLTCAYHLRRRGHRVTVFEKDEKPGGTLNTIPDYRLPKDVLQEEIDVLRWLRVDIRTGAGVAGDGCMARLRDQFDAVYIGVGAVRERPIDTLGADLRGVYHGFGFLKRLDAGENLLGRTVAIVGGGDVALDSLRTALRTCEEVHFVYRRSALEMPANREEVFDLTEEVLQREWHHLALELNTQRRKESIRQSFRRLELLTMERMAQIERGLSGELKETAFSRFDRRVGNLAVHFMAHPARVLGEEGRAVALELVRMELGPADASGRREPKAVPGSEFVLDVDTVIFAIGQEIDVRWLGQHHGIELLPGNRMRINADYETSIGGIYAGGDAARGPSSMIEAMGDGRYAAEAIDRTLTRARRPTTR